MLYANAMRNQHLPADETRYHKVFLVDTVEVRGSRPLAPMRFIALIGYNRDFFIFADTSDPIIGLAFLGTPPNLGTATLHRQPMSLYHNALRSADAKTGLS